MKPIKLIKSFRHAIKGIGIVFRTELSFRVQLLVGLLVIVFMLWLPLLVWQRIILLLLIASVLVLEVINSIFERLVDAFKPRLHPVVGEIKDMMAAAVLLDALVASIVGILLFWPYLKELLERYV